MFVSNWESTLLAKALCKGVVWHKRLTATPHQFSYKLNMWLIELSQLQSLNTNSRLVNMAKMALYRFKPAKYLKYHLDNSNDILAKIKSQMSMLGIELSGAEKILFLGQLSNCGLYFSPLNLYFFYIDGSCRHILAEVSNTPWNERYYYLLDATKEQIISDKKFHVSPFFNLQQQYRWTFKLENTHLKFTIDSYENNKHVFTAGYSSELIDIKSTKAKLAILRQPFSVYKIVLGIYFEALRLWLKRVPFVAHPRAN